MEFFGIALDDVYRGIRFGRRFDALSLPSEVESGAINGTLT